MPVNLSVKNVPDALAAQLRARAERHHRSLQRELLSILEEVIGQRAPGAPLPAPAGQRMSIDEAVAQSRRLFPRGTGSSVEFIRAMRDGR